MHTSVAGHHLLWDPCLMGQNFTIAILLAQSRRRNVSQPNLLSGDLQTKPPSICNQVEHAQAVARAARQEVRRSHSAIKPLLASLGEHLRTLYCFLHPIGHATLRCLQGHQSVHSCSPREQALRNRAHRGGAALLSSSSRPAASCRLRDITTRIHTGASEQWKVSGPRWGLELLCHAGLLYVLWVFKG